MKNPAQAFCASNLFEEGIGQVVITRHKSAGYVEMGVFLVDTYCLGVKNAFFTRCDTTEFDELIQKLFPDHNPKQEYSAAWGRKLVEESVEYARRLGFAPHRDYKKAARVMGGINPNDCDEKFVFGKDGKPFFIGGPNDTQKKCDLIIKLLTKKCGTDGFHFIIPGSDADRVAFSEDFGF